MPIEDLQWLVSPSAAGLLGAAADDPRPELVQLTSLRKLLSPVRAASVVEQARLRKKARAKFEQAERLFFTSVGLEQATDQWIAQHKAERFHGLGRVLDLCCGIGGDALGLASAARSVEGVDLSAGACVLAGANARALGRGELTFTEGPAEGADLAGVDAWHADPDRRPSGKRTSRIGEGSPDDRALEGMLERLPHAAVKLSPGARVPANWLSRCELEWISRAGECRQQVAWFGRLAREVGKRRATVVYGGPAQAPGAPATFVGPADTGVAQSGAALRFVFEQDPAISAAGLTGALADALGLVALGSKHGYLTGDHRADSPFVTPFEVVDTMPLERRRVAAWLAERRIGRLEVKARGKAVDPETLRRELKPRGDGSITLLVAPVDSRPLVIAARRVAAVDAACVEPPGESS